MRRVDFNQLPRSSRERFVRSLSSGAPSSAPLLARTTAQRAVAVWWGVLGAAALGALVSASLGFGALDRPVQDRRFLLVYVLALGAGGFAAGTIAMRRAVAGALPYAAGVYVFPVDLVDARTREIVLHPIDRLQSVEAVHHEERGVYKHSKIWIVADGEPFTFETRDRATADAQVARVEAARQAVIAAAQGGGWHELATLDPFAEAKERDFAPAFDHGLRARAVPAWTRFVWAIGVLSGLVLGVGAWRGRNVLSDGRAFARLEKEPSTEAVKIYLAAGGLHAAETRETVVPRADLDRALAETGTARLLDLERFFVVHPKSTVDAAAQAAFASALHEQFGAAKTVRALRAFVARWPEAADVPSARAEVHRLYEDARADVHAHPSGTDNTVVPAIDALLAFAEQHPEGTQTRVRRRAVDLAAADRLLEQKLLDDGGAAAGGNAVASPLFVPPELDRREAALVAALERGFERVFPADVLALRLGAPIGDADVDEPTLVVDFAIRWSGTTYVASSRGRRFLGLSAQLDVALRIPGGRTFAFGWKIDPPDNVSLAIAPRSPWLPPVLATDPSTDGGVYDVLFVRGGEASGARLVPAFFDAKTARGRAPELF